MAQSGFTPIQLFRTSTAAAVPTAGNLAAGELAINLTDEALYFKNAAGVVTLLADSSGALGTVTSVAVSGGTTGLTTSGGPITTSGTITLAGTLGVANGGTGTATAFTAGSVVFAGASGVYSQDNANLFWDNANDRLGIGTATPSEKLTAYNGTSRTLIRTASDLNFSGAYLGTATSSNRGASLELVGHIDASNSNSWRLLTGQDITGGPDFVISNAPSAASYAALSYTERMRINTSGNVGIGTASPVDKLEVFGGNVRSALAGASSTTFRGFAIGQDTIEFASLKAEASAGETRLTSGFSGFGGFTTFHTNGAERMRIDGSGNVSISNGNLVIGTANKGIDFSANSHAAGMTSELLNDYEEGTFTPTLSSSGTAPTVTGYINRFGTYTKIGNRVFISVNIRATITNAGTGTPQITGFPYASSGNALNGVSFGLTDLMNVTFNANFINGSQLTLALSSYNITSSAYITFSAMYEI